MQNKQKIPTRNKKNKEKIMIALITNQGILPINFVSSLMGMYEYTKEFYNISLKDIKVISNTYVDNMRNIAVDEAQKSNYDYLFMLDVDMIYPKNSIVDLMKHKKEVIGGLYYRRKSPHLPVHWKKVGRHLDKHIEWFEEGKIKQVGASGGGGVLFKVKAFKKLKRPYFQVKYINHGMNAVGEDIDYCFKIKGKIKFFIDPKIKYAHIHTIAVTGKNEIKEII
jgi:cellulose synthase/poly-beta-1,6-N-acetylglucosamine synthase-like glycosyltransferase